jgi:predicted  nucleic acid-binding Zn-ribbon protein
MPDLSRDISLLVQIARVDAALHEHTVELSQLPARIAAVDRRLAAYEDQASKVTGSLEDMKSERRALEQGLQDDEARVAKFKNDLMSVKSNKEYTAVQKEIAQKQEEIGQKEERLLELMDAIEEREASAGTEVGEIGSKRDEAATEKKVLEERREELQAEVNRLESEKPKLLAEVEDVLRRKYQRLLDKHGDVAVTRVEGETCGGCHTQLPPQLVVEVRKNDQLITCQSCGRILVYYAD